MKPWKSKKFFGDLVYDLRNRNLLLVVLMLLVAIVAVPLLISKSSSGNAPSPLDLGAQTSGTSPETENAVVAYHPGVRNFKSRLKDLSAKDPFKEQFAARDTRRAGSGPELQQHLIDKLLGLSDRRWR